MVWPVTGTRASRALLLWIALVPALAAATAGCSDAAPPAPPTSSPEPAETSTGCLRADGGCLGPLTPGSYESVHFTAFGAPSPGQFRYSVNDEFWANALDHVPAYWFQPAEAYAAGTGDDALPGVYVWADVAAASQGFPACPEVSDP